MGMDLHSSDLSTGENMAAFIDRLDEVVSEIYSVGAKEIVVSKIWMRNSQDLKGTMLSDHFIRR
ncbi:hypothetical protein ACEQPO_13905 [Bacillus sp. SL00103]